MSKLLEPSSPVRKVWKPECKYLFNTTPSTFTLFVNTPTFYIIVYKIQLEAPTPKALMRQRDISDSPDYFGYEYHGNLDYKLTKQLLSSSCDGSYLIRQSPGATDFFTLSIKFDERVKHFKIYYKPNLGHYLKEDSKRFETIHELVADGLVTFYMQKHAAPIIKEMMSQSRNCYQQSPYMTLNRRKLRALSNDLRKSIKGPELLDVPVYPLADVEIKTGIITNEEIDVLPIVYEKPHHFKIHTFKGLNWCELCANFLWGFTAQGVKCEGEFFYIYLIVPNNLICTYLNIIYLFDQIVASKLIQNVLNLYRQNVSLI